MTRSAYTNYFVSLFNAVIQARRIDESPLSFSERINEAIQPYLREEYQRPLPPLHEV